MKQGVLYTEHSELTCPSQDYILTRIENSDSLDPIRDADLVVILFDHPPFAHNLLSRIRQSIIPCIFLKPVILLCDYPIPEPLFSGADLCTKPNQLSEQLRLIRETFRPILEAIQRLPNPLEAETETNLPLKILRYLHVRNATLSPVRGIYSPLGYHYPQIDFLIGRVDHTLIKLIEFLELQNLISGKFIDKASFCSNCFSAFMNYREICPQCSSVNLKLEDVLHHFPCAYVGPEPDFIKDDRLICPKCRKELKHIGVDYDKPSVIYTCLECDYATQEPQIDTLCYNCGRKATPENLIHRDIKEYTLTALANNAALYGIDNLFTTILHDKLKLTDVNVFKDYLEIETSRIKRYKRFESSLTLLNIENLDEIYLELGDRSQQFFNELAAIIKAVLRTSDIITAYNDSIFLILLTETPQDGALIANTRLEQSIRELIQHNLAKAPQILTAIQRIDGQKDANALIKELTGRVGD